MKKITAEYTPADLQAKRALLAQADSLLTKKYGDPSPVPKEPVHELILTILSQNTSDHNRDRAFKSLQMKYPDWESIAAASPAEIETAIRSGGLAKQKSKNIVEILNWVHDQSGSFNLDWLGEIPLEQALSRLTALKGVGIKTASVVMCFSFDAPVFPVDVHVHRICRRLELSPHNGTAETTHGYLQPLIPGGRWKQLHLNLLKLGRTSCRPSNPDCPRCPLADNCPYPVSSS